MTLSISPRSLAVDAQLEAQTRSEAATTRHRRPARRIRPSWERIGGFVIPLAIYLVAGWQLAVRHVGLPGDALARTTGAAGAVLSRDPHLEAIGFVWPPFPSLWQVPLMGLSRWWPVLVSRGFAAVIVSAVLMAWTMATVRAWLQDCGVGRTTRLAIVAACALQPFLVLYGANGMSEAGMLCFLVIAVRRLARWIEDEHTLDLITAGVSLGLAYLTRYESVASIAFVVALVGVTSFRRTSGSLTERNRNALVRVLVVGIPAGGAVALWAFVSWAVVGQPFAQFSSAYGNSLAAGSLIDHSIGNAGQLASASSGIASAAGGLDGLPRVLFFGRQFLVFGGGAALLIGAALLWWGTRCWPKVVAILVVLGGPLAFQLASSVTGATFAWGRFVIAAALLGPMLAGPLVGTWPVGTTPARWAGPLVIAVLIGSLLLGASVIARGDLQTQDESDQLAMLVHVPGGRRVPDATLGRDGDRVAEYLDQMNLEPGAVLADEASTFPVIANSVDERIFVIPADRDFDRVLADPAPFGVLYLLVPDPRVSGFDAVNDARPDLFDNGAGIAHLVSEWDLPAMPRLRLYELDERLPR